MKKYILLLMAGFLFFSCTSSRPYTYSEAELVPTEKALLWKISGNGAKQNSYLMGTIHIIPKKDFKVSPQVNTALRACKKIAFEIDMKEMTDLSVQIGLLTKAFMPNGLTLRKLVSPEDYTFIRSKMDDKSMPISVLEKLKPMFLSMMLQSDEEGTSKKASPKTTSVEMELYKIAKKNKISSAGLETAAYQMSVFDSIPYEAQAKMLVESLRSEENPTSEFEEMVKMYKSEDIAGMQSMISGSEGYGEDNIEEMLLNRRNRNWIDPMAGMMRKQPTFFAVGAGHLGGKSGVIALLRKAGFRVEAQP